MNTVYFVIPVYKVEKYLRVCVDSVLAQTYKKIRVILIDDGSPDNCPSICDKYAEEYENVEVIHEENRGLSEARNSGLRLVFKNADSRDYISFVDSDDFIHPCYAEQMIHLASNHHCDIVQCGYEKGSGSSFSGNVRRVRVTVQDRNEALLGYELRSVAFGKLYRMDTFVGVFYPAGMWNEDEFTTYRAVYRAERIAFTNERLYYYRQREGSIMDEIAQRLKNNPHRRDWLSAYEERISFFEKHSMPEQELRTREKICTDIILRYSEQMRLPSGSRDSDCTDGIWLRLYRDNYRKMIKRRGIPLKRRLMYTAFWIMPYSSVAAGRVIGLRR